MSMSLLVSNDGDTEKTHVFLPDHTATWYTSSNRVTVATTPMVFFLGVCL